MMIGTPIGSPNWAAHYFIKRQAKKISVPIANQKHAAWKPEGSFPSSFFPDAQNWHHNNFTIFNSAIAICVFTRKFYPGSTRDHPPEIGRPFEGWRYIWRCRQEGLRSCKVCEAGVKEFGNGFKWFVKRVLQKIGVKYHIWLQTVSCRDVYCDVRPVVLRLKVCCKNGFV